MQQRMLRLPSKNAPPSNLKISQSLKCKEFVNRHHSVLGKFWHAASVVEDSLDASVGQKIWISTFIIVTALRLLLAVRSLNPLKSLPYFL